MIEQPRLAAAGIGIMALGVLWMVIPHLRGISSEAESDEPPADATTETASTGESTIGSPSESDKGGTATESTASPSEGEAVDDQSIEAGDTVVDTEPAATPGDDNPPDEGVFVSGNDP